MDLDLRAVGEATTRTHQELDDAAARHCPTSTDGTGEHCNCWFNPPNGPGWGEAGLGECCYCEGEPYCQQVEEDDSARREWDWADANGGGW